ncbi:thioredoxin-related protein [Varunaivibrio sulfuroxidans]|uniref:Thioredoxin-related protein n=1 Tax=Varunaivibrio sulfuroxidans TaxID=1773489 RepID=A0A4R3JHM5_9PROT|nr:thioredoxin family protein [Varunaivibrio sulfuroxidans]TCS64300.1 thioredoxin-related protein [Varunaivibrio sulfuroxidans]
MTGLSRRSLLAFSVAAAATGMGVGIFPSRGEGAPVASDERLPVPALGEDGLYVQPWFLDSFLELSSDLAETSAQGKRLAIMWEQRGCPYCRETHLVNLRQPKVVDYITKHFNVIQMNLWGDREVVDFDGEKLSEKKLARKYGVQFTPTIMFFKDDPNGIGKLSPRDREVWRLLGYWKPFHFLNSFVYVSEKAYEKEPNFQRWLQGVAEEMQRRGEPVNLW